MPTEVLTSPRSFFTGLATTRPSLKTPGLIIILMGLVSATTGYLMSEITEKLLSGTIGAITLITTIGTMIISLISPIILWLGLTIILMIVTRLGKGTGEFRRFAEIAGYAMLPLLIGALIGMGLATYYIPGIAVQPVTSTDPDQIQAAVTAMMNNPALKEYTIITSLMTMILTMWVANILSIGLEVCCGLPAGRAVIGTGAPALLSIIYTGYGLYTQYGVGT
ncbi:MAG TPA: Yip1 family protein [Methanospirillum sp.]|nr:Yip1 family protein [Methanospirillum sp.]